uniref:Integrase catalytic domain-containing protein n=2 Tax=Trichogramma kaykai TaxID=54128 RepID=A0ABD2WEF1_9HYME
MELTAIYLRIKHFHHELEGREFSVYCDHKPLQYAFMQAPEHAPVVRQRQLAYISQYTTSIKYLPGAENPVADALSRISHEEIATKETSTTVEVPCPSIDAFALPTAFSLEELSQEQSKDDQLPIILAGEKIPLPLQKGMWPVNNKLLPIFYNTEEDLIRPYIPVSMRDRVIDLVHKCGHPGPKSTTKLIKRKYQNKVSRHTKLIPALFPIPDDRFAHVHLDLVTLQESEEFTHALTMIDRFSRWPEAVPIPDMNAETLAHAFVDTWVARYGVPETVTSDQGQQFEGGLFNELCKLLGTNRVHTTPCHPESNGIIERWHRDFKTALMCFEGEKEWTKALPLVMLGLRTRIRSDIDASPAEIMYGSTLRLPGEFFSDKDTEHDLHFFTEEVRAFLKSIKPVLATSHNQAKPFIHKNLATCSHVFVRANQIKKALESPYKLKTVSTSRIKPAFGTFRDIDQFIPEIPQPETQNFNEEQLVDDFDVVKAPDVPFEVQTRQKPVRKTKNLQKSASEQSSSQPQTKKSTRTQQKKSTKTRKKVKFNVEHSYSQA